jgi:hypothetical protein
MIFVIGVEFGQQVQPAVVQQAEEVKIRSAKTRVKMEVEVESEKPTRPRLLRELIGRVLE